MVQTQDLRSRIQIGRQSEEEYLLRQAKHRLDIDPNDQSDLPRSSNDKDMRHKRIREMGIQKYLRKNCYHRIECTAATFLAAFILRRPLRSNNTKILIIFIFKIAFLQKNFSLHLLVFKN